MRDIDMEVTDARVIIDFARTGLTTETLVARVREVLPLLCALLSADDAFFKLSEDELAVRERGYLAINMMCQGATQKATSWAELLQAIADGSESIADHGFPEFEGGQSLDV
ncbi:MAG: hypothetical protein CVT70_19005 [Alphaproteobacteria bacterium HGW-Alphaproteobacteria-1]|jgi:hypothetical protein|nr:MAG: hypothetical protein CVT70_19005 [Alphaproteobacteria bacterium HGW-Alphaproteobacteria-1]